MKILPAKRTIVVTWISLALHLPLHAHVEVENGTELTAAKYEDLFSELEGKVSILESTEPESLKEFSANKLAFLIIGLSDKAFQPRRALELIKKLEFNERVMTRIIPRLICFPDHYEKLVLAAILIDEPVASDAYSMSILLGEARFRLELQIEMEAGPVDERWFTSRGYYPRK